MLRPVVTALVVMLLVAVDVAATPASTVAVTTVPVDLAVADGTAVVSRVLVGTEEQMLPVIVGVLLLLGLGGGVAWYTGALPGRRTNAGGATTEEPATVDEPTPGSQTEVAGTAASDQPGLLSDEDRVVDLLEENGGRMKQVQIVDQTDWSKSKVSMLLSDMEEDGQISKLRVGRENIISLAGEEPDAAGSPFDEE